MELPLAARRSDASPFGWAYQPWRGGILQVCAQPVGERELGVGDMLLAANDLQRWQAPSHPSELSPLPTGRGGRG
jgi:hypothetical protein